METVALTIDGAPITVPRGTTVLQAAIGAGISIPYYCYHPGLGVDGSCRVCVVKIEKMPKLQTACSTACVDGMAVSTRDPEVVDARAGIFEFLLINHPLDCPVCDKGGECPLQDFSYSFGPAQSRMDFPRRVFDGEGVKADVDFGPTLMLNRNRCILCTRCVRFMQQVDGDAQIGIVDRGSGSEIATFEEAGVHSLVSGNLMDVCPVGAITTRDYRFKSRPWDNPNVVDTVCTQCSKGCNTSVWIKAKPEWARGSSVVRITPRFNPDVNGYWMCDIGRFRYHWVEGERRLRQPLVRVAGQLQPAGWQEVMRTLRDRMPEARSGDSSSVQFLVSAHASTEEMFLIREIALQRIGVDGLTAVTLGWTLSEKQQPAGTTFRVPSTDAPNVNGASVLGFRVGAGNGGLPDLSSLRHAIEQGLLDVLLVVDPGPARSMGDLGWLLEARASGRIPYLVVQGVEMTDLASAADIVLPGAVSVEKDGLYTNDQGSVQAAAMVFSGPGEAREDWEILINLGRALGATLPYDSAQSVRRALADSMPTGPYASAGDLAFARPVGARHWLQASNPSERWKWDLMFQDGPPVKGHSVQTEHGLVGGRVIKLEPVGGTGRA